MGRFRCRYPIRSSVPPSFRYRTHPPPSPHSLAPSGPTFTNSCFVFEPGTSDLIIRFRKSIVHVSSKNLANNPASPLTESVDDGRKVSRSARCVLFSPFVFNTAGIVPRSSRLRWSSVRTFRTHWRTDIYIYCRNRVIGRCFFTRAVCVGATRFFFV